MRTTTTRAAAVSAGTLILCLSGGGVAAASMLPTPTASTLTSTQSSATAGSTTLDSAPPPGDIVKLVQHAADTLVAKVTTAAGLPQKTPTSGPAREPGATNPTLRLPNRPAHTARTAAKSPLESWSLPAGTQLSDLVPSLPADLAGPAARTPLVASRAGSAAPATQVRDAAQAMAALAERGNSTMRAVLVALAAASAATLAVAHTAVARGSGR